jgi:hypothetical protein
MAQTFKGESQEYCALRDQLLEAEIALKDHAQTFLQRRLVRHALRRLKRSCQLWYCRACP